MSTIQKGIVSTTETLQDGMKIDMREEMSMLDADESQFSTFTMKSRKGTATREKINWREKEYFPRMVTCNGVLAPGGTALVVTAGHGQRILRGDVLRNMAMGDAAWVSATPPGTPDTVTVVRGVGTKVAQSWAVGDTLLITSNAHPQGADFPDTAILLPTLGYNYTQIFRHGWSFSRTARAVEYYGRGDPADEQAQKGLQHKRAIEYSGFWGARGQNVDALTGEPVGFAGGLVEFITTNRLDASTIYGTEPATAGNLTVDELDNFLRGALQFSSSSDVVMYVSPLVAMYISKFNRGGMGTAWKPANENVAGLKVDAFMSGVYGTTVPIVVKKDWNDFPAANKQFGGWAFIVDHSKIEWKTLSDGDTALLTNRQLPGGDRVSEEFLTEGTWEIRNERAHSLIFGVL